MARPRKTTQDALVDSFADMDLPSQERVLDLCELVHRQANRRAAKAARGKDEDTVENSPGAQIPLGERDSG